MTWFWRLVTSLHCSKLILTPESFKISVYSTAGSIRQGCNWNIFTIALNVKAIDLLRGTKEFTRKLL